MLTSGLSAFAQGGKRGDGPQRDERRDRDGRGGRGGQERQPFPPFLDPNPGFIAFEMRWGGRTVKGAPYSAQATSEHTQTLSNGTRISRKSTAQVYRDSEGRTRHEEAAPAFGPFAASSESPQMIFINDPVARVQYSLNPREMTATRMRFSGDRNPPYQLPPSPGRMSSSGRPDSRGKQEDLGKQMIEGVEAEGTRFTFTIPTGQIGNDRPIEIVSERWFSPALQIVLLSKHSDPRFGESVYRLTNINRDEPATSLFEVPADYKLRKRD
jgi:hypothetical protein